MKTITKSQYLYLKSKKNAELLKNETVTIEDEEYEDLIQYSNKQITPIDGGNDEPQEIYTITFKDGDEIVRKITGPMGTYVSVPYIEKEGYEFLGWSLDGEKVTMPVDGIYDSDITYIAVWEKIEPQEEIYDYKDSDFGINGIGYKIISLEERTAAVWILCIFGDVIIPNEVIYNNVEFKVTQLHGSYFGIGWMHVNECKTITFNKYINMNNYSNDLYELHTIYYYVNEENPYMTAINGVLYNKDITKLLSYKNNEDYIMPNSVIELENYSFTNIFDNQPFTNKIYNLFGIKYYKNGCKKIIFNDNIETIYGETFYCNSNIEYIKLSNKIKMLPPSIFTRLDNLKELILPSELEQILTNEYNQNWTTSLENITIYNSNIINYKYIQHIQRWYGDGTIAEDRYENTNIYVFNKLSNLKELHIVDENPVELEDGIFTDGKYFTLNVYVPQGCKNIYENTQGWNKFYNIIEE